MERDLDELRELAAAYVLHALDPDSEREFEAELRRSEPLRREVAELQQAAASLAYAVPAPEPPAGLRGRILDAAVAERDAEVSRHDDSRASAEIARRDADASAGAGGIVIPFRRRAAVPLLGAFAAAAAAVAIGLGIWGSSLSGELDRREAALAARDEVAALVATPGTRTLELAGVDGTLVVGRSGEAALVVNGLADAPGGYRYQAWVIPAGEAPIPAGRFDGGDVASLRLSRQVTRGETVAVTVEVEAGVPAPTSEPIFGVTYT